MIPTRRRTLIGGLGMLSGLAPRRGGAIEPGGNGLYQESWYVDGFLDLPDELAQAGASGRRLVLAWELKGCPACRRMHLETLSQAAVVDYLSPRFAFVQLDFVGAREVTALDGRKMPENRLAQLSQVQGTPTFQVFDASGRELDRIEGFVPADRFLAFLRRQAPDA